ncbi:MAG TPA: endolytic transglycosylase MltG [Promineifilum sp.]|nr:endolytic transglycosylase MltG [Promineifilum sp.]HRO89453.1 endolytic transglycosylase MltG [Promineifilum sp.]HRQ12378.1 endolytic transglycosylase MltG [Promineifilum sp.]
MANKPARNGLSPFGYLWRILVVGTLLIVTAVASWMFYRTWLGEGLDRPAANPNLSQSRRLYLEYYLTERAAEMQRPAGTATGPQALTVSPGEGAAAIAQNLQAVGLLTNTELFLNYLTYYGLDSGLVAGQYTIEPGLTIPQLVEALGAGGARALELSFLPGWRSEEMANYLRVVTPGQIDGDAFLDIVHNPHRNDLSNFPFFSSLPDGATLEGYLFPGAYSIEPATDSAALVRMMLERFDQQVTPAMRQAYGAQGLSLREALILASIIEKEAMLAEEKPIMAAVFLNRLRSGMPLQADPTVQYALGYHAETDTWWKSPLDAADLDIASPYNTYQINGLPPGPISNPGLSSLEAIAAPADADFLFFVLDCAAATTGRHIFSATYEEHLANVERCR